MRVLTWLQYFYILSAKLKEIVDFRDTVFSKDLMQNDYCQISIKET